MRKILATLLFLFAVTVAFAQQKVTGSVIDENGEPLIGATVKAKGSADGTVTDLDGHYTFNFGKDVKFLEVSYIGYKTQYVPIKNGKADVQLKPDEKMLDETVVIGYGSVKKGDVTNAVAKVKADELEDRPVGNIANALQGELAGVDIQSTSGAPGSSVQVRYVVRRRSMRTHHQIHCMLSMAFLWTMTSISTSLTRRTLSLSRC